MTALTALNELASRIVWLNMSSMSSLFFVFIVAAATPAAAAVACAGVWFLELAVINPRGKVGISISQGPHRVRFTADDWRLLSQAVIESLRDPRSPEMFANQ